MDVYEYDMRILCMKSPNNYKPSSRDAAGHIGVQPLYELLSLLRAVLTLLIILIISAQSRFWAPGYYWVLTPDSVCVSSRM